MKINKAALVVSLIVGIGGLSTAITANAADTSATLNLTYSLSSQTCDLKFMIDGGAATTIDWSGDSFTRAGFEAFFKNNGKAKPYQPKELTFKLEDANGQECIGITHIEGSAINDGDNPWIGIRDKGYFAVEPAAGVDRKYILEGNEAIDNATFKALKYNIGPAAWSLEDIKDGVQTGSLNVTVTYN